MIIFGLSGGIATGKSLVAKYFKMFNAKVFDADDIVHDLYQHDSQIISMVKNFFPDSIVNNIINRKLLFSHFLKLSDNWIKFQSIIHSLLLKKMHRFILLNRTYHTPYLVLDIPLLIEANFHFYCDFIIRITTNHFLQKQRVLNRNISEENFNIISSYQISSEERKKHSDFVIHSGLNMNSILQQIKWILRQIQSKKIY